MTHKDIEYKIIDMESYKRKKHFLYFKDIGYPYVGITANVEITDFLTYLKNQGLPFFLTFLHQAAKAANAIPEYRRRIRGAGIVEYSTCYTSHTVMREDETFCYCDLNHELPFDEYLPYARQRQEEAKKEGGLNEGVDEENLYFISSLPWVSYNNLIQAVPLPADSNPRFTFGKYFSQEGRMLIPVTVLAHHGLVDGIHLGRFYEALEQNVLAGAKGDL